MSEMTRNKPKSYRGHKFRKRGNMLSGGCTLSESWYACGCGDTFEITTHMSGPEKHHYETYSKIERDCPLAEAPQ